MKRALLLTAGVFLTLAFLEAAGKRQITTPDQVFERLAQEFFDEYPDVLLEIQSRPLARNIFHEAEGEATLQFTLGARVVDESGLVTWEATESEAKLLFDEMISAKRAASLGLQSAEEGKYHYFFTKDLHRELGRLLRAALIGDLLR